MLEKAAFSIALCRWRHLSAFLLHPNRSERTSLPGNVASLETQSEGLTDLLNTFLSVFVEPHPNSRHEQASHLRAVVREHGKLGYMLLSQPGDWNLITEESLLAVKQDRVVLVEAGLEKLSGRDGVTYSSPRRVLEPEVLPY